MYSFIFRREHNANAYISLLLIQYEGHPINRENFRINITIRWDNLMCMQQHIQKFYGM